MPVGQIQGAQFMTIRHLVIPAALAALLVSAASPAMADKKNDTLTWLSNSEPDNIDMYENTLRFLESNRSLILPFKFPVSPT
jgi:hypothetical protein